jgi:ankyrin repeat protein
LLLLLRGGRSKIKKYIFVCMFSLSFPSNIHQHYMTQYPQAASTPNANNKIPLHYAAREGHSELVDFLVRCQPHTAAIPTNKQKLALHFAAGDGHVGVVQTLLQVYPIGASMPSAKGKIPLHFAARWGHLQIAKDLLEVYPEGASTLDWEGSLPLHDAAREGQYEMARYLIQRYPLALATANLQGEIPLFPAVRSRNLELVILCVQAWPMGGKHVLVNVSADDNLHTMGWDMVELLLHGAVGNVSGCRLLASKQQGGKQQHNMIPARLSSHQDIIAASPSPETQPDSSRKDGTPDSAKAKASTRVAQHPTDALLAAAAPAVAAAAAANMDGQGSPAVMDFAVAVPRSKSPILEILEEVEETDRKKQSSGRKRPRLGSTDNQDVTCGGDGCGVVSPSHATAPPCPEREQTFIALHAALECGASSHVIRYILTERPEQVELSDDLDRLPLHLAVAQCRTEEQADLVLDGILQPFPEASLRRDAQHRLPLHIAIASPGTSMRVIAALLLAFPTAGVEPCRTNDEWHHQMPIHMACHFDCCLSSVYLLLRADPSSMPLCS